MHNENHKNNHHQIEAALAVNIQTAIALWEMRDWPTYQTTRQALLAMIRSGQGDRVGIEQMRFIYFINTHLRHRFLLPMRDQQMFLAVLPASQPAGDPAWTVATEGHFWAEAL